MSDEGVQEIQLGGKQLVFLFMAATVVSVVIFLCGVLVGRGVQPASAGALQGITAAAAPDPEPLPVAEAGDAPRVDTPPAADELSYPDRLGREGPPVEILRPAPILSEGPALPPALSEPAPIAPAVAAADVPALEPVRAGFAVQVAALRERGAAESIVRRLVGRGYPAYVLAPAQGAPAAVYRVRVGTYDNRGEAEDVASRLQSEEQFKPWIIR